MFNYVSVEKIAAGLPIGPWLLPFLVLSMDSLRIDSFFVHLNVFATCVACLAMFGKDLFAAISASFMKFKYVTIGRCRSILYICSMLFN